MIFNKYTSPKLRMNMAQVSMFVTLSVTNVLNVICNFQAALVGPLLSEEPHDLANEEEPAR